MQSVKQAISRVFVVMSLYFMFMYILV